MTDLISKLNSLAKLTPDEIAARLHTNGWIRGELMTADEYKELENKRVYVVKLLSGNRWNDYGNYAADWGLRYVNINLANHWFKLATAYGGEHDRPYPAP